MKSFKSFKFWSIILSAISIICGVVIMIDPAVSAVAMCNLLGAMCIIFGIFGVVRYFKLGIASLYFRSDLASGLFSIVAGILMLLHPAETLIILPVILGFYIIASGIYSIQAAFELKRAGVDRWWVALILGLIIIILGILMIRDPFTAASALMMYMGAVIVAVGIEEIFIVCWLGKALKTVEEAAAAVLNEPSEAPSEEPVKSEEPAKEEEK